MKNTEYWLWYWGINQKDEATHSKKKKFTDFNRMKNYSAKHSKNHQWIGRDYWSNYDKVEVKYKPIK